MDCRVNVEKRSYRSARLLPNEPTVTDLKSKSCLALLWAVERYRTATARRHVGNQSSRPLVHCHFGGMAA